MIKRMLILLALVVAVALGVTPSPAESICANAGAAGLTPTRLRLPDGVVTPTVCVPVP